MTESEYNALHDRTPLPERVGPGTDRELPSGPVLLFAPHPDDDLIGAGCTAHLHQRRGDRVRIVIAYDGNKGRPAGDTTPDDEYIALRETEARRGGAHLELDDYLFLRQPEGHVPDGEHFVGAVSIALGLIEDFAPGTIYAPWIGEHNLDHHVLSRIVRAAVHVARGRAQLRGQAWTCEAWAYEIWSALVPTRVVDISDCMQAKLNGLREHATQNATLHIGHHIGGLNAHRALYLPFESRFGEAFAPLGEPAAGDLERVASLIHA